MFLCFEILFSSHVPLLGWPDSVQWLNELKKDKIIVSLSNGNMSLLIDMVCSLLSLENAVADVFESLGEACKFALGCSVLYRVI